MTREKGTLGHCWWECRLVQPLWKTMWNFLKKLKVELPYDLAFFLVSFSLASSFKGQYDFYLHVVLLFSFNHTLKRPTPWPRLLLRT